MTPLVYALAGKEKGKLFYVLGQEGDFLLLADGKRRRVEQPKRKKEKHAQWAQPFSHPVLEKSVRGEALTNREVRELLAIYKMASKED